MRYLQYILLFLFFVAYVEAQKRPASRVADTGAFLLIQNTSISEGQVVFYNLTREVVLSFNEEIEKGNGGISLNSDEIPLENVIIDGKKAVIPLNLIGNKGYNKPYVLRIAEGTFVKKNKPSVQNVIFTLSFETFRKANVPDHYAEMIDLCYSEVSPEMCRLDFYFPVDAREAVPVLINMHGGGWARGHKEEQTSFTAFTNMGFAVANIEYRMTPHATAPAAVEDVRCAMRYLVENASSLNIDPRKMVLQGSSAGAHLALVAGYLQNDTRYDSQCIDLEKEIKVMAVVDKYGPADLWTVRKAPSAAAWLNNRNEDENFVKSLSPVHLVSNKTPPTYIVHGDNDKVVPKQVSSDLLVSKLIEYGIKHQYTVIKGGGHGKFSREENTQINNEIMAFVQPLLDALDKRLK